MSQTSIMDYKGKKIFLMDLSNTPDKQQVLKTIDDIKKLASTLPPDQSMLGLVDISGSPYDKEIVMALKELAAHNKHYMKMTACVGVVKLRQVILRAIIAFSGRKNLVIKETREEALEWLSTI